MDDTLFKVRGSFKNVQLQFARWIGFADGLTLGWPRSVARRGYSSPSGSVPLGPEIISGDPVSMSQLF